MSSTPGLFSSLRHRDYRLLMASFTASAIGSWAYNVAFAVWIFDETGSAGWLAVATIGRFLPALLFSSYGGVIAERFERVRLMSVIDMVSFAAMAALAFAVYVDAPVLLAIIMSSLTSCLFSAYEPAVAATTPQLVTERHLASANALRSTIDNLCVIIGPGIGAGLLLVGPPEVAIALNAATFLTSSILVGRIHQRSRPVDVTEGGAVGPFRQMLVGIRAIGSTAVSTALVTFTVVATFVFGVDTVLFVVVSRDVLGTGAEGYGYLLAGLGVGGVLAAGLVPRLERLPALTAVILIGMTVYCLPTLALLVIDDPYIAFALQVVRGAGTLVVDVLAVTALQRTMPGDVLARAFGALDGLMLIAILVGASLTPLWIGWWGLEVTLWIMGLGVPVACLAGWPLLRRMDRDAAVRREALRPTIALLEGCDLFESVSDGSIDQLAAAAEKVTVTAGDVIVAEGDEADAFYVIVDGVFSVHAKGERDEPLRYDDMTAGAYFGEIGLIERVPRTATVAAVTDGKLLRVEGQSFIDALTETKPSVALLDGASLRLGRTHPSRQLTRSALDERDIDER